MLVHAYFLIFFIVFSPTTNAIDAEIYDFADVADVTVVAVVARSLIARGIVATASSTN